MGLTRHAQSRLRRLRRDVPEATPAAVLEALLSAGPREYDESGKARAVVYIGGAAITLVLAERGRVIVTLWRNR